MGKGDNAQVKSRYMEPKAPVRSPTFPPPPHLVRPKPISAPYYMHSV